MVRERLRPGIAGLPVLILLVALVAATVWFFVSTAADHRGNPVLALWLIPVVLAEVFLMRGLMIVAPNEAQVLQLFGDYAGSARVPGLRWTNPFYTRRRISLRVRSFESSHLKVNDKEGNPIEIGAVVVWRVLDSAEATFEVDDYENYVRVQRPPCETRQPAIPTTRTTRRA
jgi:regulator of protease activity HflC (stomatin/prohibitin superfamily)